MAASKAQGRSFTVFLVGLTLACAGVATWSRGSGKLLLIIGVLGVVASLVMSRRIKPLEGKVAQRPGGEAAKLAGAFVALLGWLITLGGLQVVGSTGGRIALALVGIATSLYGIVVILPAALNQNAIWKT
jgi:hypothetical protein